MLCRNPGDHTYMIQGRGDGIKNEKKNEMKNEVKFKFRIRVRLFQDPTDRVFQNINHNRAIPYRTAPI